MKYIFVSYASGDAETVLPIVQAVDDEYRRLGLDVEIWVDSKNLSPGQRWDREIARALRESVGMLVFISPAAMRSDWVGREIIGAAEHHDRLIIPVVLAHVPDLPPALAHRQWIDLSGRRTKSAVQNAARQIAQATQAQLGGGGPSAAPTPPIATAQTQAVAATIAQEVRGAQHAEAPAAGPPESVFVVHGHDAAALSAVETYLKELGVRPVVLTRIGGPSQSLLQKFLEFASAARFAIVILSADDMGASRKQYEADGVGDRALQFRTRQNVILELGFFYGLLGWENVFALYKPPDKPFPNFEWPSDLAGVVYDPMGPTGEWRKLLAQKLKDAGFRLRKAGAKKNSQKAGAKKTARKGAVSMKARPAGGPVRGARKAARRGAKG